MTLKLLVEKLARSDKKFITKNELEVYCRKLSLNYLTAIKYLIRHRYLARIFRGIFYVYSIKERKLGERDMDFYDILKEALKIKGVSKWYFGLETALKLNNLTHESFTMDFIMNDAIFRAKPILIMGRKVKFYRLTLKMFSFGILKKSIPYSDPEKTLLDLLHLKHYSILDFKEGAGKLSKKKLLTYARNYNKKLQGVLKTL